MCVEAVPVYICFGLDVSVCKQQYPDIQSWQLLMLSQYLCSLKGGYVDRASDGPEVHAAYVFMIHSKDRGSMYFRNVGNTVTSVLR
jgi:hypothetical protein